MADYQSSKDNSYHKILALVEGRLNRGNSREWSDNTFKILSDELHKSTGDLISHQTLKRAFGKIKTKGSYKPSEYTLDVFAKYIGYGSYGEFVSKNKVNQVRYNYNISKRKKALILYAITLLALIGIFYSFFIFNQRPEAFIKARESLVSGGSVSYDFEYSIPDNNKNYFFEIAQQTISLPYDKNKVSVFFKHPGYYRGILKQNGVVLDSTSIHILNPKWFSIAFQQDSWVIGITESYVENSMNIPYSIIQEKTRSLRPDYLQFHHISDTFKIDGEGLHGEIFYCNKKDEGGKAPFGVHFNFQFQHDDIKIYCNGWRYHSQNEISTEQETLLGRYEDLSTLSHEEDEDKLILFSIKDGYLQVYSKNKTFNVPTKNSLGLLKGITINSNGNGKIHHLYLDNKQQNKSLRWDFAAKRDITEKDLLK